MRKLRQQLVQKTQTQLKLTDNEEKFRIIDDIELTTGLPDRKSLKEKVRYALISMQPADNCGAGYWCLRGILRQ
jgi:hypothetical protein